MPTDFGFAGTHRTTRSHRRPPPDLDREKVAEGSGWLYPGKPQSPTATPPEGTVREAGYDRPNAAEDSVAQRGAVASRVGAAFEETLLSIDANGVGVPHVVVPVRDHLHGLPTPLQLAYHLIADASFERQIARGCAPGPAHEPARRLDRLLHVVAKIDDARHQGS